jgi:hypothetical protein
VPGEASYFSRFAVKFVEIVAAGVATALSGYLIAHLGGFLAAPTPAPVAASAAVEATPRPGAAKTVAVTPRIQPPASAPAVAEAIEPRAASQHEPAAAAPAARTTANAGAATTPARKRATADTGAAEAKPRDKDDKESVEAQVRAALANVGASRPAPSDVPLHQAAIPAAPGTGAQLPQPRPLEGGPMTTGAIATAPAAPRAPDAAAQPMPQTAIGPAPPPPAAAPAPLAPVEIKSRPVADVDATPGAAAAAQDGAQQANAQDDAKEDKGLLATIKKIPELLRPAAGATTSDPPRPPLPVGEQQ